jgi:acyl-ACP thioesterase
MHSQDIDFSNHVNNAVYVRDIMNSLSNDFLDKVSITDVEMHYIAESKEGQILKIYK